MGRRSNCFVFAWWLYFTRGGYCALRRTRHMPFGWHWLWCRNESDLAKGRWIHYEPITPKELPTVIWHKVWYRGVIRRGDRP